MGRKEGREDGRKGEYLEGRMVGWIEIRKEGRYVEKRKERRKVEKGMKECGK